MIRSILSKWFGRKPKQTTFVYCPACEHELCANGLHLGQDPEFGWLEQYLCNGCGCYSMWDFGAPAPLLMNKRPGNAVDVIRFRHPGNPRLICTADLKVSRA